MGATARGASRLIGEAPWGRHATKATKTEEAENLMKPLRRAALGAAAAALAAAVALAPTPAFAQAPAGR